MSKRTRSHVRLGIVAAIVAAASISPAAAFHTTDPPAASYPLAGGGGVAVRATLAQAGPLGMEVQGSSTNASSYGFGTWLFSGSGSLMGGVMFSATGNASEIHVEAPVVGVVVDESGGGGGGFTGLAVTFGGVPAGDYILAMGGTTDGDFNGTANVFGNLSIGSAKTGPGFHLREGDFHGGVNVIASDPAVGKVKALAADTASVNVAGKLLGWFGSSFFDPITALSYSGPAGGGVGSPHYFFYGAGAGTYKFNVDLSVGAGPFTGVWAWGVDLALS